MVDKQCPLPEPGIWSLKILDQGTFTAVIGAKSPDPDKDLTNVTQFTMPETQVSIRPSQSGTFEARLTAQDGFVFLPDRTKEVTLTAGSTLIFNTGITDCFLLEKTDMITPEELPFPGAFEVACGDSRAIFQDVTGKCFAQGPEIVIPTPVSPELFEVTVITRTNPDLPPVVVTIMREIMLKGGFGLNNIRRFEGGYIIQVERVGSITLGLLGIVILAALAVLAVVVVSYSIIRLSDNTVQLESRAALSSDLGAIDEMLAQGLIDENTATQLRDALTNTYAGELQAPKRPVFGIGGFGGDAFANIAVIGALILAGLAFFTRR